MIFSEIAVAGSRWISIEQGGRGNYGFACSEI